MLLTPFYCWGTWVCFHFGAIIHSAALNTCPWVNMWTQLRGHTTGRRAGGGAVFSFTKYCQPSKRFPPPGTSASDAPHSPWFASVSVLFFSSLAGECVLGLPSDDDLLIWMRKEHIWLSVLPCICHLVSFFMGCLLDFFFFCIFFYWNNPPCPYWFKTGVGSI